MVNREDSSRLQAVFAGLPDTVDLVMYALQKSEFSRRLEDFAAKLCRAANGKVRMAEGTAPADFAADPCLGIRIRGGSEILWAAVPEGHQLDAFLKTLQILSGDSVMRTPIVPGVEFQLLVSSQCPRCPVMAETLVTMASRHKGISCRIMDVQQFPDQVRNYGIQSVPATVLDRQLVLTGMVTPERLFGLIRARGSESFEGEVVRSLIERRRIAEAAAGLIHEGGRAAVLSLLQQPEMSARMGALVVMEKALDDHSAAVGAMVPRLIGLLADPDARIRGDIADLLGKTGDLRALKPLEAMAGDPDPDVVEAAEEAVAALRRRQV